MTWAEKQQKAFERQMVANRQEGSSFFAQDDSTAFFEQLYNIKIRHGFYTPAVSRDMWIKGCGELYDKCRSQPIPAMLLPALLTIFSTDEKEFSNLYAYFKYKNRRFSEDAQKQVLPLFKEICEAVIEHISGASDFAIPIFHWFNIKKTFCSQKNLSGLDAEITEQYFDEYCNKNDLSKAAERKLLKFSCGNDIRSLAKLCNLNTYIMMNQLPYEDMPAKAKRPLRQLVDGKLLPKVPSMEGQRVFDQYFCDLYQEIPAIPAFSQLALLRYYRIPLDYYIDTEPDFFPEIEESIVSAILQYSRVLQHDYWEEQQIVYFRKGERYQWLNGRAKARTQYRLDNILERHKFIKHSKAFANHIIAVFTEDDYKKFIRETKNFHVYYFPEYLRCFCEKYSITEYMKISDQEMCFWEDEAFSTILAILESVLLKNIHSFWIEAVDRELYR